ncbi:hypothetical protein QNN00_23825 [Bacillus velezensis]|nr:hypothetical protein [Bacillus velezensis]
MAILIRQPEDYKDLLKEVFADYGLPYFIDGKASMRHHPLIEFIRSSLDVVKGTGDMKRCSAVRKPNCYSRLISRSRKYGSRLISLKITVSPTALKGALDERRAVCIQALRIAR